MICALKVPFKWSITLTTWRYFRLAKTTSKLIAVKTFKTCWRDLKQSRSYTSIWTSWCSKASNASLRVLSRTLHSRTCLCKATLSVIKACSVLHRLCHSILNLRSSTFRWMRLDQLVSKLCAMSFLKLSYKCFSAPAISSWMEFCKSSLRFCRIRSWRSLIFHFVSWRMRIWSPWLKCLPVISNFHSSDLKTTTSLNK